jgi:hypothetical protein
MAQRISGSSRKRFRIGVGWFNGLGFRRPRIGGANRGQNNALVMPLVAFPAEHDEILRLFEPQSQIRAMVHAEKRTRRA